MSAVPQITEERRHFIGGSDLAPILGQSSFKTPLDVFLLKTGQKQEDDDEVRRREMGVLLEPGIRVWAARELLRPIASGKRFVHPKHHFLVANTDGCLEPTVGVEIKTMDFSTRDKWGEPGTDEIPIDYLIQTNWYCGLAGWDRCVIVRFDRGTTRIEYYQIAFDKELFDLCVSEAVRFWKNHVCKGVPPEPTAKDGGNIIYLFPTDDGEVLVSDEATDAIASEMAELYPTLKKNERRYEELKGLMKVKIGPHKGVDTLTGKFTVVRSNGQVSWKAIASQFAPTPEIINQHRGGPYATLRTPFREEK